MANKNINIFTEKELKKLQFDDLVSFYDEYENVVLSGKKLSS